MIHGQIEHLTQDGQGYVYWRGQHVEHYSFRTEQAVEEAQAALELRDRCIKLEALGVPVSANTAVWRWSWYADLTPAKMEALDSLVWTLLHRPTDLYEDDRGRFAWVAKSHPRGSDEWKRRARIFVYDPGEESSFMLDSDDYGGYYHPLHALGWKSAQMGQGKDQGCCYATTAQLLAWFDSKMGVAA